MSKLSKLVTNAQERMGPELSAQLNDELRNAAIDIRRNVLEKGWFGEPVTPNEGFSSASTDLSEAPAIEADTALYEEMWGDAPEAEDLYGVAEISPADPVEPLDTPEVEVEGPDIEPEL